ncbi:hypothetical protein GPALN_013048 [Globodera pallida]|nr:hypothetical protein GPALN_013048 [Globodera pallida]
MSIDVTHQVGRSAVQRVTEEKDASDIDIYRTREASSMGQEKLHLWDKGSFIYGTREASSMGQGKLHLWDRGSFIYGTREASSMGQGKLHLWDKGSFIYGTREASSMGQGKLHLWDKGSFIYGTREASSMGQGKLHLWDKGSFIYGAGEASSQNCKKCRTTPENLVPFVMALSAFDCAFIYQNQSEIGNVLKEMREELFITSKVWNTFHSYDAALANPMGYREGGELFPKDESGHKIFLSDVHFLETWRELENAVAIGKVFEHPTVSNIASLLQKANAQVALRFLIQFNVGVVPKSSDPQRQRQNLNVELYLPVSAHSPHFPFGVIQNALKYERIVKVLDEWSQTQFAYELPVNNMDEQFSHRRVHTQSENGF